MKRTRPGRPCSSTARRGSGKELIARLYHESGPRADGPFIAVNCAAIPEGVAERLLFGARKARSRARGSDGYLQSADGGTLFLDEIADLDPAVQAKLLRAIETREVMAVGATQPPTIDIGIVAASHRELRPRSRPERSARISTTGSPARSVTYRRCACASRHRAPRRARIAAVDGSLGAHAASSNLLRTAVAGQRSRAARRGSDHAALTARDASRDVVRPAICRDAGLPRRSDRRSRTRSNRARGDAGLVRQSAAVLAALEAANGVVSAAARWRSGCAALSSTG